MTQIMSIPNDISAQVTEMHHAHYKVRPTGLVIPTEAPNANTIYHLFNDGSIEATKGGDVYGQRSMWDHSSAVVSDFKDYFKFPKNGSTGYSYALLTLKECNLMREKMATWGKTLRDLRNKEKNTAILKNYMDSYGSSIYLSLLDSFIKGEKMDSKYASNTISYVVNGADPDITNSAGETLLMWAAATSCDSLLILLLDKADLAKTDRDGHTFLHYITNPKLMSFIIDRVPKELLSVPDVYGNNAFQCAVLRRNYELADIFLAKNPDLLNSKNIDNETVLFYLATTHNGAPYADKLIQMGIDKTVVNVSGKTAQQVADEYSALIR